MKSLKRFLILLVAVVLASCFDPPQFPNVPEIEFESIVVRRGPANKADTLILTISFRDGDGNLGIDPASLEYLSYPFNNIIYYQTNSLGQLVPLNTYAATTDTDTLNILDIPNPSQGKLVFPRTRKNPLYASLPQYACPYYEFLLDTKLLIPETALGVIDSKTVITDTLRSTNNGLRYFEIQDTLYYSINPNHYNIEVDFYQRDPGNPNADADGYVEFDWQKEYCTQSFDGRFPILSGEDNALEGTLTYRMISLGFRPQFGSTPIKLKVSVKDRDLNKSNTIDTGPFTL